MGVERPQLSELVEQDPRVVVFKRFLHLLRENWAKQSAEPNKWIWGPRSPLLADVDLTLISVFFWRSALGTFFKFAFLVLV